MALCYSRTRKFDEAHKYLDRVEKINADFTGLHLTRGGLFLKQKKIIRRLNLLDLPRNLEANKLQIYLSKLIKDVLLTRPTNNT